MFKTKKTIKNFLLALTLIILINVGGSFANLSQEKGAWVPTAFAEGEETPAPEDFNSKLKTAGESTADLGEANNAQTTKDLIQEVAKNATKAHRFFAPFINFLAFQIGNFLGNDYVYQGSMGLMLHKIWIISRNLVNITFVFYLLWIAVKTIISPESGWDELKKKLGVFTLALIAVNFSWLATKVILDSASVVTHAVFAIPSGIGNPPSYEPCVVNTNDQKPLQGLCYPTKIIAPADANNQRILYWQDAPGDEDDCSKIEKAYSGDEKSAYNADGSVNTKASPENKALQGRSSMCMESLSLFKYDQNTAVIYLTYGMARIQNLVNATASGGDGVQLAVGVLMSIILQIVYGLALLALFLALIVRMMMLWILVGFSPFIILLMGLSSEGGGDGGDFGKQLSLENFMSWAFVPAKVGAVFVVAFIMISAGQAMGNLTVTTIDNLSKQSGFTFKLLGQESLFAGIGSLQDFIWLLMTIAVLWMGVFAVLGKLELVGNFFTRMGELGKSAAEYVPEWLSERHIIPKGKGEFISPKAAFAELPGLAGMGDKWKGLNQGALEGRITKNVRNVDYEKYKHFTRNGKIERSDANEFAKEFNFRDNAELMKANPDFVRSEFRKMKHADRYGQAETDEFYKILAAAEGINVDAKKPAETASPATPAAPGTPAAGQGTVPLTGRAAEADTVQPPAVSQENVALAKAAAKADLTAAQTRTMAARTDLEAAKTRLKNEKNNPGAQLDVDKAEANLKIAEAQEYVEEAESGEVSAYGKLIKQDPDDSAETISARNQLSLSTQKKIQTQKNYQEALKKSTQKGLSDGEVEQRKNEAGKAEHERDIAELEAQIEMNKVNFGIWKDRFPKTYETDDYPQKTQEKIKQLQAELNAKK